ncbi:unnamed protein product [Echinostoma caproni]|uniref:Isopentenyl-diphosphate Delta-isomerase n=1 Tax=Echinostoma caproni TaxID=27848 RepID=A0A3P8HBB5_9TREM|nr:unnamed protein product [Echinostoma caproni]
MMLSTVGSCTKTSLRCFTSVVSKDAQIRYMNQELCFLVDEEDRPVGTATKKICHEQQSGKRPPLHRAFSLFLYAPRPDCSTNLCLLMQQRAASKLTYPNLWSNTCCSHPLSNVPGEDEPRDALGLRRASRRKVRFIFRYHYIKQNPHMIQCNPDEVSATRWVSRSELDALVRSKDSTPTALPHTWSLNSLTPWFRTLLTTGLLHRLWDWAETYANRKSNPDRFEIEDECWDRERIQKLDCAH